MRQLKLGRCDRSLVVARRFKTAGNSLQSRLYSDPVNSRYLWKIYTKADPNYSGRVTVPVLWDKETATIVNNESVKSSGCSIQFDAIARKDVNFYPEDLRAVVDETIDAIYQPINNGVYRAGFATTQLAKR